MPLNDLVAYAPRRGCQLRTIHFLLVVVLTLALFAVGRAAESLTPDAKWWQTLTRQDQLNTIVGLVEGYSEGYHSGYYRGAGALYGVLSPQSRRSLVLDGRYMNLLSTENIGLSKTYGTYVDEIAHFYENCPGLSDLPVGRILQCMVDHPSQSCDDYAIGVIKAREHAPK